MGCLQVGSCIITNLPPCFPCCLEPFDLHAPHQCDELAPHSLSLGGLLGLRASADAWSRSLSALGCCSAAVDCLVDTQRFAGPFWSGKSGVEESIGSRGENDSAVARTRAIECTHLSATEN